MLKSLVAFWDPTVMVFRFGEPELTPTLEEYAGLLKLTIFGDPVLPNFKPSKSRTADFLGMRRDVLEKGSWEVTSRDTLRGSTSIISRAHY